MAGYNISDEKILKDIKDYLFKYPTARKEQLFKYLTGRYGAMDRDDFAVGWNNRMTKIEEGNSEEDAWVKYERGYNAGQSTRRTGQKSTPSNSVELVGYQDAILGKKKSIPDVVRNTIKETEPHGRYAQTAGAGQFDPRTFGVNGGIDDVTEAQGSQSTEIEWQCPHCKQITQIPVEIESPSDYIACADCEHCGKEISDPKLDQKVYQKVIDYYAGKADYLKDTRMDEGLSSKLKPLFAALLIGYAGSKSGLLSHFQHTPEGQKMTMAATKMWNSVPVVKQTTDTAKKIWAKVMTPAQISDPTKELPSEKGMGAYDLASKYSDRNDDVAQKTSGFVGKYLPPEKS